MNCGACGRVCAGACLGVACELDALDVANTEIFDIESDASAVYFSRFLGPIRKYDKPSATVSDLLAGTNRYASVHLRGNFIYMTQYAENPPSDRIINRCLASSCAGNVTQYLGTNLRYMLAQKHMHSNASKLVFAAYHPSVIRQLPVYCTSQTCDFLSTDNETTDVVFDGTRAYWSEQNPVPSPMSSSPHIRTADLSGGVPGPVTIYKDSLIAPSRMAVGDDGNLYWVDDAAIYQSPLGSSAGAPTLVASAVDGVSDVLYNQGELLWISWLPGVTNVEACTANNCEATRHAAAFYTAGTADRLWVDDEGIYVSLHDGASYVFLRAPR